MPRLCHPAKLHAAMTLVEDDLDAESWDAFPPDWPLAFRVGADAWRYVTLVGPAGLEYGIATFASWSAYQAPADPDGEDHDRLGAAVPPLDAPFYRKATDARRADDAVPLFARFEKDGLATPEYLPSVYAAWLELLARRAGRVTTRVRDRRDGTGVGRAGACPLAGHRRRRGRGAGDQDRRGVALRARVPSTLATLRSRPWRHAARPTSR